MQDVTDVQLLRLGRGQPDYHQLLGSQRPALPCQSQGAQAFLSIPRLEKTRPNQQFLDFSIPSSQTRPPKWNLKSL